ncbi:MAG TPA: hypothetical protein VG939_00585, partial [Caulobacteraceae bacterium]|nr:hypothetical protein [Caulobacteraceae bacterium]
VAVGASLAATRGLGPGRDPGGFVLGAVLLLGLARLWAEAWVRGSAAHALAAASASLAGGGAYALWHWVFARLPGLPVAGQPGAFAVGAAIAVTTLMTALVSLQLRLPGAARSVAWARAYAAVANGFYLNTFANRWVLRLWPARPTVALDTGVAS